MKWIMVPLGAALIVLAAVIETVGALNDDPLGLFVPALVIAISGGAIFGTAIALHRSNL